MSYLVRFEPLLKAREEAEIQRQLATMAGNLGFEHVLFAVAPKRGVSPSAMYLWSNYPQSWLKTYEQRGLREIDPTVAHCFRHSAPLPWAPETFRTPDQQALYLEACAHGLRAGVVLPCHGPKGEAGMLACLSGTASDAAFKIHLERNMGDLTLLRDLTFDRMHEHIERHFNLSETPKLTNQEKNCLQWLAVGKTTWEISRILNISEAGVNFHMSNLRQKFSVSRRHDVVMKAIRLNLIDPS